LREFVQRTMHYLIDYKLASQYSYLGRRTKEKFSDKKIAEVVIGKPFYYLCAIFISLLS